MAWWRDNAERRRRQAAKFLATGSVQYTDVVSGETTSGRVGCVDSSQCGSGFFCSEGYCVEAPRPTTAGTSQDAEDNKGKSSCAASGTAPSVAQSPVITGTGSSFGCGGDSNSQCGDADIGNGGGEACASRDPGPSSPDRASSGGCKTNTCGEDPYQPNSGPNGGAGGDCCGVRCCRYSASGTPGGVFVSCQCGECKKPPRCDRWCDAYKRVNHRTGPGCDQAKECSECEYCNDSETGATCEDKSRLAAPCHCSNSAGCESCEFCDGETGSCEPDCDRCRQKIQVSTRDCGDGAEYHTIDCLVTICDNETRECQIKACQEAACKNASDSKSCKPYNVETKTLCGEAFEPFPACPEGMVLIDQIVNIVDWPDLGQVDFSCSVCEKSEVNEDCQCNEPCNCHTDCADCYKCSEEGCVPDEDCPGEAFAPDSCGNDGITEPPDTEESGEGGE